eukprot:scaffold12454_cov89-Skeletonema_dohrnii-CCMP3373.AAC.1
MQNPIHPPYLRGRQKENLESLPFLSQRDIGMHLERMFKQQYINLVAETLLSLIRATTILQLSEHFEMRPRPAMIT